MTEGSLCRHPGCSSSVDEAGYCDENGHPVRVARPSSIRTATMDVAVAGVLASDGPRNGGAAPGTVSGAVGRVPSLPFLPALDPEHRVQDDPRPPRRGRTCGKGGCQETVGAALQGRPAPVEGFCPRCRTPFSFKPKLRRGDLVHEQYEVVGCLAHGGLGWVYLARDKRLDDKPVALKGLINTNDATALKMEVNERQFLTFLDHPNIVRIVNFVPHPDPLSGEQTGYIVMDYVGGRSLLEIQELAESGRRPFGEALRAEHVVLYGIEILAAFEYLHGRNLLYCDMKPANVMHSGDRIKLIDLGAVREIDDRTSAIVGTPGFQVPMEEIHTHGLSVRSDLHTLGKTLERLLDAADRPMAQPGLGHESCHRIVRRATHPDPFQRFGSAAEMSEQLHGVLRELLSVDDGEERPETSARFAPTTALLDAGLGAVPSLARWTEPRFAESLPDGRPSPLVAATGLPTPLVEPDDPAAESLASLGASGPRLLIDKLAEFTVPSAEIPLLRCRASIELAASGGAADHLGSAGEALDAAAALTKADRTAWRLWWHRGLLALAHGDVGAATEEFDRVYGALPGEEPPKLALGFCAEHLGDLNDAERYYRAVWCRDRSQVSAAFGLARVCLGRGERQKAVEILNEVPKASRHYETVGVALFRIHLGHLDGASGKGDGGPVEDDVEQAQRKLSSLYLDGGDKDGEARVRLVTVLQETALGRLPHVRGRNGGPLLGDPVTERGLRERLEQSFRRLARQARLPRDHETLIDRANAVRPTTSW